MSQKETNNHNQDGDPEATASLWNFPKEDPPRAYAQGIAALALLDKTGVLPAVQPPTRSVVDWSGMDAPVFPLVRATGLSSDIDVMLSHFERLRYPNLDEPFVRPSSTSKMRWVASTRFLRSTKIGAVPSVAVITNRDIS